MSSSPKALTTLPRSASIEEVRICLERDGGVIVEDMLSSSLIDNFMNDVDPYLNQTPYGEDGFIGNRTKRASSLLAKSMHTAQMVTQPHFLGVSRAMLQTPFTHALDKGDVTLLPTVQISITQVIQICAGQGLQPLHRDDGLFHVIHPAPQVQVQVIYAGTDFTEANGATRVVPGSHLWDSKRRPTQAEAVSAVMKKGSGLIYFGGTYHGGGMNTTEDVPRTAIAIAYIPGYLRQEENQYLAVPLETVRRYPLEVQKLMGYEVSPPFCGWLEMQDPLLAVTGALTDSTSAKNFLE